MEPRKITAAVIDDGARFTAQATNEQGLHFTLVKDDEGYKEYLHMHIPARVGDLVQIIHTRAMMHKEGDILKIKSVDCRKDNGKHLLFTMNDKIISDSEYVVLHQVGETIKYQPKPEQKEPSLVDKYNFIIQGRKNGKQSFMEQLQKASDEAELKARFISQPAQMIYEPSKRIVPDKRKWTDAEIQEAKNIVYDILTQDRELSSVSIVHNGKRTVVTVHWRIFPSKFPSKIYVSWCCDHDEYNKDIGLMVALCRSEMRELPVWVMGDKS